MRYDFLTSDVQVHATTYGGCLLQNPITETADTHTTLSNKWNDSFNNNVK